MKEESAKNVEPAIHFGMVLKEILSQKKISVYHLAKLAQMNLRHLQQLVDEEYAPTLITLLKIERALDLESGYLIKAVDALLPEDWARTSEEDRKPKKRGRPKKIQESS